MAQTYDPYRALADAIVEQAAKDLRKAIRSKRNSQHSIEHCQKKLDDHAAGRTHLDGKEIRKLHYQISNYESRIKRMEYKRAECEIFFRSVWFTCLCGLDGPALAKEIIKQTESEGQ